MNENNLEYLKKSLDGLGFGSKLNDVLETAIGRELPKFTLGISSMRRPMDAKDVNAPRTDHLSFWLHFNRSKDSDMYFLNGYEVTLRQQGNEIPRSQRFDLTRDHRITALQAHKLLSGLSFEKDVYLRSRDADPKAQAEKIPMWFRLNLDITDAYGNHPLRTFRPEYGFDLAQTVGRYPIKGLDTPEKMQEALTSLRNGNYVHTELTIGKKTVPVSIAANPQIKTLEVFDKNGVEIREETIFPDKAKAREAEKQQAIVAEKSDRKTGQQAEALPWQPEPEVGTGRGRGR
ncbi:hypothetical protein ACR79H_07585 [Sphingobacterium spiritivorum]|uniref:hypothetical protein n=1 Tax=Sphingobacterium spiritivorum TaxID=258 RepID=UPI003DA2EB4B